MPQAELIALVDVNNCYASCERVFRPDLRDVPVAVLSNNDGCIIARSAEVKALGFKMGDPYFKSKDLLAWLGIKVFSSNYGFYHDMTHRVFWTLRRWANEVEIYSIDEAFVILTGFSNPDVYARKIKADVLQRTKIPVSIGLAQTKTLAKVANHIAKDNPEYGGVFDISKADLEKHLQNFPASDLWGIGRQYHKLLESNHIKTAWQFATMPPSWIKKNFTIMGVRIQRELLGERMLPLATPLKAKQGIGSSRSFARCVTDIKDLREAVAEHADHVAKKLRRQNCLAKKLGVHIRTNRYNSDRKYSGYKVIELTDASAFTPDFIKAAMKGLDSIYRGCFKYWKAGVMVREIVPDQPYQQAIFEPPPTGRNNQVMQAYDAVVAKHGGEVIKFGVMNQFAEKKKWAMKRELLSPGYTTDWNSLPKIT